MKLTIFIFLITTLAITGCTTVKFSKELKPSNHFDGETFYNPWLKNSAKKSFWKYLNMRSKTEYAIWPTRVPVQKYIPQQSVQDSLRIIPINHSTVLIQNYGINILTDPIWSKRASPFTWAGPKRIHDPAVDFDNLPQIHVVLVSHNHYDHMDIETIKNLEKKFSPIFITGLGNEYLLKKHGVKNVKEMDWWETHSINNFVFHFVPAQHFSARWLDDRNKTLWGGFVIETPNRKKVYFAGDTGYGELFKEIQSKFTSFDVSLIPIGAYEPRSFMKDMHVNPEEAVLAHMDLKSKKSIGIHFGTFQMTAEAYDSPKKDLDGAIQKYNLDADDFIAPEFGTEFNF